MFTLGFDSYRKQFSSKSVGHVSVLLFNQKYYLYDHDRRHIFIIGHDGTEFIDLNTRLPPYRRTLDLDLYKHLYTDEQKIYIVYITWDKRRAQYNYYIYPIKDDIYLIESAAIGSEIIVFTKGRIFVLQYNVSYSDRTSSNMLLIKNRVKECRITFIQEGSMTTRKALYYDLGFVFPRDSLNFSCIYKNNKIVFLLERTNSKKSFYAFDFKELIEGSDVLYPKFSYTGVFATSRNDGAKSLWVVEDFPTLFFNDSQTNVYIEYIKNAGGSDGRSRL